MTGSAFRSSLARRNICSHAGFSSVGTESAGISMSNTMDEAKRSTWVDTGRLDNLDTFKGI